METPNLPMVRRTFKLPSSPDLVGAVDPLSFSLVEFRC
jgi:hypothetical protein